MLTSFLSSLQVEGRSTTWLWAWMGRWIISSIIVRYGGVLIAGKLVIIIKSLHRVLILKIWRIWILEFLILIRHQIISEASGVDLISMFQGFLASIMFTLQKFQIFKGCWVWVMSPIRFDQCGRWKISIRHGVVWLLLGIVIVGVTFYAHVGIKCRKTGLGHAWLWSWSIESRLTVPITTMQTWCWHVRVKALSGRRRINRQPSGTKVPLSATQLSKITVETTCPSSLSKDGVTTILQPSYVWDTSHITHHWASIASCVIISDVTHSDLTGIRTFRNMRKLMRIIVIRIVKCARLLRRFTPNNRRLFLVNFDGLVDRQRISPVHIHADHLSAVVFRLLQWRSWLYALDDLSMLVKGIICRIGSRLIGDQSMLSDILSLSWWDFSASSIIIVNIIYV